MTLKTALFDAMTRLGVTVVRGEFSGGNDEGGYNEIELVNADKSCVSLDPLQPYFLLKMLRHANPQLYGDTDSDADRQTIRNAMNEALDVRYGSFAGDFDVSGTVEANAKLKTLTISGAERSEYTSFAEDL
jgi:hypothetical protein